MVIAGENRNYVAVLALASAPGLADDSEVARDDAPDWRVWRPKQLAGAQRVLRLAFLDAKLLSLDAGDLTDKGTLSQRNILRNHASRIEELYDDVPPEHLIRLNETTDVTRDRS